MKTLAEHKKAFREMVETLPTTGCFRQMASAMGFPTLSEFDTLQHLAQAERDVRRLGLHRVMDALDDLTREELREFVTFLVQESRERQEEIEDALNPMVVRHMSRDLCRQIARELVDAE
jgi:hypothetical protein